MPEERKHLQSLLWLQPQVGVEMGVVRGKPLKIAAGDAKLAQGLRITYKESPRKHP